MDVDPYMPVQEMKSIVLAFAIGCFVLIAILDAWFEYTKFKKKNTKAPVEPECSSADEAQTDDGDMV